MSTQTHETIPSASSTFITDLQTFLRSEDALRFVDLFTPCVISGGTHGTAAGLTATPAALLAYPGGYYTTETGSITYQDASTTWVIAHSDTTGNQGSFTRVSGTHYLIDVTGTQPSLPSGCLWLMKVTTSGGAITAVVDLRTLSPTGQGSATVTLTNTSADAATIQAAMDAVGGSGGGRVVLGAGTGLLGSTSLVWKYSNITVQGSGLGATTLKYTGSNQVFKTSDNTTLRSNCQLSDFTIDATGAGSGVIGVELDNMGDTLLQRLYVNATGVAGIGVKLIGDVSKSTYWNVCRDVHIVSNTTCILISGLANANTFYNGRLEGSGKAVEILPQASHNTDSCHFYNVAMQTTGATMIHLGTASGGAGASGTLFFRSRMEPGTPVSVTVDSGATSNFFLWPIDDGNITWNFASITDQNVLMASGADGGWQIDTVSSGSPKKTINLRAPTAGLTFGNDTTGNLYLGATGIVQTDGSLAATSNVMTNRGGATALTIGSAEIQVTGSNTNQNLYLESKGTGAVLANSQNGATGGLGIQDPAGASATWHTKVVTVNSSAAATLTAASAIPAGAIVLGVTAAVLVAFGTSTGLTSFEIGDGTTANKWAATAPITLNAITTSGNFLAGSGPSYYPTATNLVLTSVGGNFDATGQVRLTITYFRCDD